MHSQFSDDQSIPSVPCYAEEENLLNDIEERQSNVPSSSNEEFPMNFNVEDHYKPLELAASVGGFGAPKLSALADNAEDGEIFPSERLPSDKFRANTAHHHADNKENMFSNQKRPMPHVYFNPVQKQAKGNEQQAYRRPNQKEATFQEIQRKEKNEFMQRKNR